MGGSRTARRTPEAATDGSTAEAPLADDRKSKGKGKGKDPDGMPSGKGPDVYEAAAPTVLSDGIVAMWVGPDGESVPFASMDDVTEWAESPKGKGLRGKGRVLLNFHQEAPGSKQK